MSDRNRSQGPEKREKDLPLAGNVDAIAEWFTKTVQQEQEQQENLSSSFEPGEGVEEVLGD